MIWFFAIIGMLACVLLVVVTVYLVVATYSTYPDRPSTMSSPTDRRTNMAQIEDAATIEIFRARSIRPRWRFRIRSINGQITAQSSESYVSRDNAFRGARDFRNSMIGPVGLREVER